MCLILLGGVSLCTFAGGVVDGWMVRFIGVGRAEGSSVGRGKGEGNSGGSVLASETARFDFWF
jgi:hypothetical protein